MTAIYKQQPHWQNLNASFSEKKQIIYIYALHINKLLDYYNKQLRRIISSDQSAKNTEQNNSLIMETKTILGTLLIEQYYNTGDFYLFDRAVQINEQIRLKPYSIININEAEMYDDMLNFVVFFKGIFLRLHNSNQHYTADLKLLTRDKDMVVMINQKLDRARQILEIDEITLGKKYYDGLCNRSHYWHLG